jgi:A/G-specific adenine glycosylase
MLQQTRVNAVLEHYKQFLKKFPTVRALAHADVADVLAVWSGLGYYRRARMLHRAAKLVAEHPSRRVPESEAQLRLLPGIGRYTANAIASIAFGEPVAVVDGNVERVLARLFRRDLSTQECWTKAQTLLDTNSPGEFNQAMMELGATICLPGIPLCGGCPVKNRCASRGKKRETISHPEKRLRKYSSLLLVRRRGAVLLRKRAQDERLMPGMWELPETIGSLGSEPLLRLSHAITTNDWRVSVFSADKRPANNGAKWIALAEASQLPLTGLTRKILRKLNLLS